MGRGQLLWNLRLLASRKLFAVVLSISFVLSPLSTAFAQETPTETSPADTGADTTVPPADNSQSSPSFSIPGVDSGGIGSVQETDSSKATQAGSSDSVQPPTDS